MPDIEPKEVEDIIGEHDDTDSKEPDFVFGFVVRGVANGMGVKFDPIDPDDDPSYARKATVDDMLHSCKGIVTHIETGIVAAKVCGGVQQIFQGMQEEAIRSKIKGKLH